MIPLRGSTSDIADLVWPQLLRTVSSTPEHPALNGEMRGSIPARCTQVC